MNRSPMEPESSAEPHVADGRGPVATEPLSTLRAESGDIFIAERLRRARQLRGLTLSEVASQVGLSHNFLSMVERGMTDLSLARFRRLAEFYGIPPADLLTDDSGPYEPQITPWEEGLSIQRGAGVGYRLMPNQEFGVQIVNVRFEPGARFDDKLAHEGADIVWVTKGRLVLIYGEREYEVSAGQCVSYKAGVPHSFENRSRSHAELVGVVTAPYW